MSGIVTELVGYEEAILTLDGIENAPLGELNEGIGRLVQGQIRHRIEVEKTEPDGAPWVRNNQGTSILFASGALSRSIDYIADATTIMIGSGLVYARIHQLGGIIKPKNGSALKFWWVSGGFVNFAVVKQVEMPARPYLGMSVANQNEMVETTEDWLSRLVQR